jgi:hypothetical protein
MFPVTPNAHLTVGYVVEHYRDFNFAAVIAIFAPEDRRLLVRSVTGDVADRVWSHLYNLAQLRYRLGLSVEAGVGLRQTRVWGLGRLGGAG